MTSTFDDIKSSWDRDEEGGCAEYNQYPIPYLDREFISHWRATAPDTPVPSAIRSLYAFEPMWPNSFVIEATSEERSTVPTLGNLVFIQTGDIVDGELTAVLGEDLQLALCPIHRCEASGRWYVQPVQGVPATFLAPKQLIGRVFKHIYV